MLGHHRIYTVKIIYAIVEYKINEDILYSFMRVPKFVLDLYNKMLNSLSKNTFVDIHPWTLGKTIIIIIP